jgi:hypothetical protein
MKLCPYCGKEYPDDLQLCPVDNQLLQPAGTSKPEPSVAKTAERAISLEEKRFWSRITFRQFAIVMLRLQACWLFINAAVDLIYIPRYIKLYNTFYHSQVLIDKPGFYTLLLRILINVGLGILIIQKAEKFLSWVVKDLVAEQATRPKENTDAS